MPWVLARLPEPLAVGPDSITMQQSSTVSTGVDGVDSVQWQQRDTWRAEIQLTQTPPSSSMELCFVCAASLLVSHT